MKQAQAELEEVTKKIFKMEQDCLDDDQFDLYQVMSTKKLPNDLGYGGGDPLLRLNLLTIKFDRSTNSFKIINGIHPILFIFSLI